MKTESKYKTVLINLLFVVFLLAVNSNLMAQEEKTVSLKNFKVILEKTKDGIKMQSLEGSAWIDLVFNTKNNKPQAIDEYGMTELGKVSANKNINLADFLFTITKSENEIILNGIEGTAWTALSFSIKEKERQVIDQFGMHKLN